MRTGPDTVERCRWTSGSDSSTLHLNGTVARYRRPLLAITTYAAFARQRRFSWRPPRRPP